MQNRYLCYKSPNLHPVKYSCQPVLSPNLTFPLADTHSHTPLPLLFIFIFLDTLIWGLTLACQFCTILLSSKPLLDPACPGRSHQAIWEAGGYEKEKYPKTNLI